MQLIYATCAALGLRRTQAVSCCCCCSSGASSVRYPKFSFALLNVLIENSWSRTELNDGEQILVSKQIGAQERKNESKRIVKPTCVWGGSDRRWPLVQRLTSGKTNNIFSSFGILWPPASTTRVKYGFYEQKLSGERSSVLRRGGVIKPGG